MAGTDAESGVPMSLAGDFRAEYGSIGIMYGAFGADRQ